MCVHVIMGFTGCKLKMVSWAHSRVSDYILFYYALPIMKDVFKTRKKKGRKRLSSVFFCK